MSALMPTYKRLPVAFTRGEGSWLFDEQGRAYLDGIAGIAVCLLGHSHPRVAAAIAEQAQTLMHTSNLYRIPLQEQLAERLCQLSGLDAVFFCNSGAEANEAAIKLARRYAHDERGIDEPQIVVADGAFHGRTLGALAATGNPSAQHGFAPLPGGFVRTPYADIESLRALDDERICAVLLEPIQGEGGVRIPPEGYLAAVRELCDARGWLLLLDEIQTGIGRTGRMFAYEHAEIRPDVVTIAKALGNGMPIGACLTTAAVAPSFGPGSHGTTFGGNPLAARAALAVLDVLEQEGWVANAAEAGTALRECLREQLDGHPAVREIRGQGLMIGIELDTALTGDLSSLPQRGLDHGLLINVTAGSVVRLLPPLTIRDQEWMHLADGVATLIAEQTAAAASQSSDPSLAHSSASSSAKPRA
ncbi:aspartate aminotransferase family protein [Halorhodospira abdelmalekii]|uniref:aspartate aminotransferase family protein n=1 Tax=Halorhodospira abdelmalekii TaxID=421629 RepID=UPI0019072BDB|nr:aspartate aminotransferase family protein [Halorhodospira abdelmalekii]MBK1735028.1 aspartate aminotransferase family protein [Halorhodospira abdelmalekii]